jgi:hypothetical protein
VIKIPLYIPRDLLKGKKEFVVLFFFISLLERATHAPSVFDARLLKVTGREMRCVEVLLRVVLSRAREKRKSYVLPSGFCEERE